MSFCGTDITEQYLNKLYEDLHKEQMNLMTKIKNSSEPENRDKEKDITKQITLINSLMMGALRLRNVRQTAIAKINSS